tara:strand:- start:10618 stop:10869 length:252 start_codon:yes stop_codon:yes gene_type:complete
VKKKKSKFTNKDFVKAIAELTSLTMSNRKHIEVLSDFFFNYLEMKGDKENYVKYMEVKANELLSESNKGIEKVSRESLQKEEE